MIPDEILSHVIYLYILRSENFKKKKNKKKNTLKALILAQIHAFHKYHTSINIVGELTLQYQ